VDLRFDDMKWHVRFYWFGYLGIALVVLGLLGIFFERSTPPELYLAVCYAGFALLGFHCYRRWTFGRSPWREKGSLWILLGAVLVQTGSVMAMLFIYVGGFHSEGFFSSVGEIFVGVIGLIASFIVMGKVAGRSLSARVWPPYHD
jgi:hypothetical protein